MTNEEIQEFKNTIEKTILPNIIDMNQKQIINIIQSTPNVSMEFKNMLLEQLLILKDKHKRSPRL